MASYEWPPTGSSSGGDVVGPGSSTDKGIAIWDGTSGDTLASTELLCVDDGGSVTLRYTEDHLYIHKANQTMDLLGPRSGGGTKQTRVSLDAGLVKVGTAGTGSDHAVSLRWDDNGTGGIIAPAFVSPLAGSPAVCSHTFEGTAGDTGMYSTGADNISFSCVGTRKAFIDPSGVNVSYATASKLVLTDANKYLVSSTLAESDVASKTAFSENDLSSVSWDGTPPSGTTLEKYRANRVGNVVTVEFRLTYSVAGVANTTVSFPLPAALTANTYFANTANSTFDCSGSGTILTGAGTAPVAGPNIAFLGKDGSGNALVTITGPAIAAKAAVATISYFIN